MSNLGRMRLTESGVDVLLSNQMERIRFLMAAMTIPNRVVMDRRFVRAVTGLSYSEIAMSIEHLEADGWVALDEDAK